MTTREQNGFLLSATLHGAVIALAVLWSYLASLNTEPPVRILELVQGEGTNYGATEAPLLGTPGGVKLTVPTPTPPKPEAAQPVPTAVTTAPVIPTPPPKTITPTKPVTPAQPSFAKQILNKLYNADRKAKREVAKERAEEEKRLAKAEQDRANKTKTAEKNSPANFKKIDTEGIAKGVLGGSAANKEGGAGGTALTNNEGYESRLIAALHGALEDEKPSGLSESLIATVVFHVGTDGVLSNLRFTKSSGSAEFDAAVRAAIRRISGTFRPPADYKAGDVELDFKAKDQEGE